MRNYSWGEEFEPGYTELYLIRHFLNGDQGKATWADIINFPVTSNGYTAINDLIENLKQMRDHMQEYLDPHTEIEYNGATTEAYSDVDAISRDIRKSRYTTRLSKHRSKEARKRLKEENLSR